MRRKVSALLGVAVAMLLSVAVAIPANAADPVVGKPSPVDPRFKYGMDYFYKELFDPTNPQGWKSLNVNETVNPSKTGGSWYLNNQRQNRTPATGTTNKPLTGKIFLPGQPLPGGAPGTTGGTVVKPPSVYKPTAPFTGALGLGRLLGTAGAGMGGVTQTPSNVNEIATSQGVAAGCISDRATCSAADMGKLFTISNCGHTSSCKTIGAKDANGVPITSDADWWKDSALPFLADLWAQLTGQTDDGNPTADSHQIVAQRGCIKDVTFVPLPGNKGKISNTSTITSPSPKPGFYGQTWWDADCGAGAFSVSSLPGVWRTVCVDPATGKTENSSGNTLGNSGSNIHFNADGTMGSGSTLCAAGNTTNTVMSFQWFENTTAADYAGSPSRYDTVNFYEWINPDPDKDFVDQISATTTVDCAGPNGSTFTYSEKVQKVGAFSAPACPEGFEMTRHDVKTQVGIGSTKTVDSGAVDPAQAAKYPLCDTRSGPGCSLSVQLDGVTCTSGNAGCHTWADTATRQPSRVGCFWGAYKMPLSDCYSIAEGYKSETGMVLDPKSGVWVAVDTVGNPVPVAPQPWNPTNPNPVAGATPGTTPANPTQGFPGSGVSPADGCVNPVWSWNPVDWVKSPAVCAMRDALEPKTDIKTRMQTIAITATTVAPVSWMVAPMVGPSGGGCPNWTINVAGMTENVVCESSFTAAIVGARGPMFGIVASAMIWPLIRSIWYALIPIVRVSPSGSK